MTPDEVYAKLQSFNPDGLTDAAYEAAALRLLKGDYQTAAQLHAHFLTRPPLGPTNHGGDEGLTDPQRAIADDCLVNVFSFKGERHSMGDDIDWGHNLSLIHI